MCGSTGTLSYSVVINKHTGEKESWDFGSVLGIILMVAFGLACALITIYIGWNLLMAALRWVGHILNL